MSMYCRPLGRTGLDVSTIGLGTEYLNKQPRETVISVVRKAIEQGVNYIDLVFSFPAYLDNLGAALEGQRDRVLLTGHLGSTEKDGQYKKSRSVKQCEATFLDLLARVGTDHVDVLMLHNCDSQKEYNQLFKPKGIVDLARRLQDEGRARFIGFSGHTVATATQAVESGAVDVLMFPINLASNAVPGKKGLLQTCVTHNMGLVAMKPYAGGKLLQGPRTVRVAKYQAGGPPVELKKASSPTPVQCLSYVLAQAGVCTTVPGCQSLEELSEALAYLEATDEQKDFSTLLTDFEQYVEGECVYCNHCLPCPAGIDIGQVMRMLEIGGQQMTAGLQIAYAGLPAKGSDCTRCGACVERCPFGVDVMTHMERAAEIFGQ